MSIQALLLRYAELARVVMPAAIPPVILNDPDDDQVLACALTAKAQLIVSGDSDLLSFGEYQGIRIAGPAAALPKMQ